MKLTVILIIILLIVLGSTFFFLNKSKPGGLIAPSLYGQNTVNSSPTPPPVGIKAPKEFKYDSSTNLETELSSINPKVETTDFDSLNTTIESL